MNEADLIAAAASDAGEPLIFRGHAEAEAALPSADRIDCPDLEALDRALAARRYGLLVAEAPSAAGRHLLLPGELIHLLRSTRTRLLLVTDLAPAELPLPVAPDMILYRHIRASPGERRPLFLRGELPPADAARDAARARDAAACRVAASALHRAGVAVRHLGLPDHPAHKVARRALRGYGARLHLDAALDPARIEGLLHGAGVDRAVRALVARRGDSLAVDLVAPESAA